MSVSTPPSDDEEDEMLERLVDGKAEPRDAAAMGPYQELVTRIRELPDLAPPEGWEARLEERRAREVAAGRLPGDAPPVAPARRGWRRAVPAVLAIAAAAAIAIVVWKVVGREPAPPKVAAVAPRSGELSFREGSGPKMRAGAPQRGDTLDVPVRAGGPHVEVRIYLDERLVFRCPGDAGCWSGDAPGADTTVSMLLTKPGRYDVLIVRAAAPLPPSTTRFEDDRDALSYAGARLEHFASFSIS